MFADYIIDTAYVKLEDNKIVSGFSQTQQYITLFLS
jgi:hypothetical protein